MALFARRPPSPDQAEHLGRPAGLIWLQDLVMSLGQALAEANRSVREQHLEAISELYLPESLNQNALDPVTHVPRMIRMRLPGVVAAADGQPYSDHDVPLAALTQHHALSIAESVFDLECRLCTWAGGPEAETLRLGLRLGPGGEGAPLRLKITYRSTDITEGMARLQDAQLRTLP